MSFILLVEDSPIFGTIVKNNIEKQLQCSIVWAQSFAEASKIIDEQHQDISVALLDLNLPDSEMGAIVDYATAQSIPSIVFTSRFDIKLHQTIWAKGVVDYVLKDGPDSLTYIVNQIKRLERNHKYKVLVVDDSPVIRKLITRLLTIHKYPVIVAGNGNEALLQIEQHPDTKLVLSDYNMPDMDGFELTKLLRRKHSHTNLAIIGLSAQGDRHISARFIKHGANDFIAKPFYAEEFYCRLNLNIDTMERISIIRESSYRDFLTGLHNRRYFFEKAERFHANNQQLCVAMIDIDFFKKVNDKYGHDTGDRTLKEVATCLTSTLTETKLIARFGGEEFCVLCTGMEAHEALHYFDQLRQEIEKITIRYKEAMFNITVSIGLCTCQADSLDTIINLADEQLYAAKQQGRNRVCIDVAVRDS